jgi:peptide-methionine (R)-S-oxide reductase
MAYNKLTEEEKRVILNKATEAPYSGKYNDFYKKGIYVCKQCNQPLFSSETKFKSGCGWPSFDDTFNGAVERIPDPDGMRTEIVCSNCKGHLGHVFEGEGFTKKDTRHCVNSLSIKFIENQEN